MILLRRRRDSFPDGRRPRPILTAHGAEGTLSCLSCLMFPPSLTAAR
jgi:hypothetical protein